MLDEIEAKLKSFQSLKDINSFRTIFKIILLILVLVLMIIWIYVIVSTMDSLDPNFVLIIE